MVLYDLLQMAVWDGTGQPLCATAFVVCSNAKCQHNDLLKSNLTSKQSCRKNKQLWPLEFITLLADPKYTSTGTQVIHF